MDCHCSSLALVAVQVVAAFLLTCASKSVSPMFSPHHPAVHSILANNFPSSPSPSLSDSIEGPNLYSQPSAVLDRQSRRRRPTSAYTVYENEAYDANKGRRPSFTTLPSKSYIEFGAPYIYDQVMDYDPFHGGEQMQNMESSYVPRHQHSYHYHYHHRHNSPPLQMNLANLHGLVPPRAFMSSPPADWGILGDVQRHVIRQNQMSAHLLGSPSTYADYHSSHHNHPYSHYGNVFPSHATPFHHSMLNGGFSDGFSNHYPVGNSPRYIPPHHHHLHSTFAPVRTHFMPNLEHSLPPPAPPTLPIPPRLFKMQPYASKPNVSYDHLPSNDDPNEPHAEESKAIELEPLGRSLENVLVCENCSQTMGTDENLYFDLALNSHLSDQEKMIFAKNFGFVPVSKQKALLTDSTKSTVVQKGDSSSKSSTSVVGDTPKIDIIYGKRKENKKVEEPTSVVEVQIPQSTNLPKPTKVLLETKVIPLEIHERTSSIFRGSGPIRRRIKNDKQLPLLRKLLTQKLTAKEQQNKKQYSGSEQTSTPALTELLVRAFPPPLSEENMNKMMITAPAGEERLRVPNYSKFAGKGVYSWKNMTLNDITFTEGRKKKGDREVPLLGVNQSKQLKGVSALGLTGKDASASSARNYSTNLVANRQSMQMIDLVNNLTLALQLPPSIVNEKEKEVEKFSKLISARRPLKIGGEWSSSGLPYEHVQQWPVNVSTPQPQMPSNDTNKHYFWKGGGNSPKVKSTSDQNVPQNKLKLNRNALHEVQKRLTLYKVLPSSKVNSEMSNWQSANNNNWQDTDVGKTTNIDHATGSDGSSLWRWPSERSKPSRWKASSDSGGQLEESRSQVHYSSKDSVSDGRRTNLASEMKVPRQSKTELLDAITRFVALQKQVTNLQSETNDTDTGGETDLKVLTTSPRKRPLPEVIDNGDKSFAVHWRPQLSANYQLDGVGKEEQTTSTPSTLVLPMSSSDNNYHNNDLPLKEKKEDSSRLLLSQLHPPLDWSDSKRRPRLLAAVPERQHFHHQQVRREQLRKRVGDSKGRSTTWPAAKESSADSKVGPFLAVDGRGL